MPIVSPEVDDLLADALVTAHLATCRDGRPHVAPVWFRYDDGVVQLCTSGRKLRDVRANPYVALSIERGYDGIPEWTVTVHGTATVVEDEEAFATVNRQINEKYGVEPDSWTENTLISIDIGTATVSTY